MARNNRLVKYSSCRKSESYTWSLHTSMRKHAFGLLWELLSHSSDQVTIIFELVFNIACSQHHCPCEQKNCGCMAKKSHVFYCAAVWGTKEGLWSCISSTLQHVEKESHCLEINTVVHPLDQCWWDSGGCKMASGWGWWGLRELVSGLEWQTEALGLRGWFVMWSLNRY